MATGQISPGNAHSPSHLCPPHLRPHLPYRYRTLKSLAFSSRRDRLICDFCSSGQCFAFGFLQIPPRGGHPCRSANSSPCRVCRGLAPPSECALPGTLTRISHSFSHCAWKRHLASFLRVMRSYRALSGRPAHTTPFPPLAGAVGSPELHAAQHRNGRLSNRRKTSTNMS